MTIPKDGSVTAADSKAIPKITHKEPIIRYTAIINMTLLAISLFAGWKYIILSTHWGCWFKQLTDSRYALKILKSTLK